MIRRINLFGGPGSGKSTLAAWMFARMKMDGHSAEHVQEYVKNWAYLDRHPTSFDQVYLMAKQMYKEDLVLRNGVDHVLTDCPIFLSACYGRKYGASGTDHIISLCAEFEETYPSMNIFIDRGDKPYKSEGRFQDKKGAEEMDKFIMSMMIDNKYFPTVVKFGDIEGVKKAVYDQLGKRGDE